MAHENDLGVTIRQANQQAADLLAKPELEKAKMGRAPDIYLVALLVAGSMVFAVIAADNLGWAWFSPIAVVVFSACFLTMVGIFLFGIFKNLQSLFHRLTSRKENGE